MVSQTFWWPRMYKWVAHYVKTCETCQRVKPSGHASAPLQSLPVPADCWKSMSLDFVFGLPADDKGNTGILVFVCRLSKMHHFAPVRDKVTGKQAAQLFLDSVFRYHGLPETIVSDRDPRFTGTVASIVSGGEARKAFYYQVSEIEPESLRRQLSSFIDTRLTLISRVRDAMALAQDKQKEYSDTKSRGNLIVFRKGDLVLLATKNLPLKVVSSVESNKLKHRFIGPFPVLARHGSAYTIDLPKSMATHPTFYVGRLKRYHDPLGLPSWTEEGQGESSPPRNEAESSGQPELPVSKSVNATQTGTHTSHTKGMT
ncbi:Inositol-3-phosphate synthase, partial [Phytophthora palmivora]